MVEENEKEKQDVKEESKDQEKPDQTTQSKVENNLSKDSQTEPVQNPIKQAEKILQEIKEQNEKLEKNMKDFSNLKAEAMLEGHSFAGQAPRSEQDKVDDKINKMFAGSGLDPLSKFKKSS